MKTIRLVCLVMIGLLGCLVWTPRAFAYAWMIRHGYTSCATCHSDPSGGGLLTQYGRAQGVLLLAQRWDHGDDEAAAKQGNFLFNAIELPEQVALGGDLRGMLLARAAEGQPVDARFILMTADLGAGVVIDRFHAQGTIGAATDGAFGATVVGGEEARLVSRTHFVGVDLGADHEVLIRAGRMNLPFGIRNIEHTSWVRSGTRTDINDGQQHGVAVAYTGQLLRGEAMFIAGNYQISPDVYRQRGYSAYLELAASEHLALGVSSLVTHAELDPTFQTALWRQAHGLFLRASPTPPLALLVEADYLSYSQPIHNARGMAAFAQADVEVHQGLHLIGTFETQNRDVGNTSFSLGGSASVAWFFAPHADLRFDAAIQSMAVMPDVQILGEAAMLQGHFYL